MLGGRPSSADLHESAWICADSARFGADPPNFRQRKFPMNSAGLRQTPPNSARIRVNPCGLRRELAEFFARKISARKNFPKISVRRKG